MKLQSERFKGRVALITGGASGLGKAVAERIRAESGDVVLWDIDTAALEDVARSLGARHSALVNVADHAGVERALHAAVTAAGRIDILVNSAGITGATVPVHEFPVDSWLKVMDVNLNGTFYCCRAVVPHMISRGYGRIINVASVAGKEGNPNASAYSASKAGVIGLTKSLGKELATRGVLVNAITPAALDTPILRQMPQTHVDYMKSRIPMGRLGDAHEVAAMICFMASEECSFATAAVFDSSGGRTTY
jgi:2-dehydro-3-deoxy-L-rhamnonate dehydrogenase (NAD+)